MTHFFHRVVEVWLDGLDVGASQQSGGREALKMDDQTPRQLFVTI